MFPIHCLSLVTQTSDTTRSLERIEDLKYGGESFLRNSVSMPVAAQYDRCFAAYSAFVTGYKIGLIDPYMRNIVSDMTKVSVTILFCQALYNGGKRGTQISDVVAAVMWKFGCLMLDTRFFQHELITYRTRRAGRKTLAESQALAKLASVRMKSPIPEEAMAEVWDLYWLAQAWSWDGSYYKCIALGILFGYVAGRRISNFTLASATARDDPRGRDHNLLRVNVQFGHVDGSWIDAVDVSRLALLTDQVVCRIRWSETTKTSNTASESVRSWVTLHTTDGVWSSNLISAMREFSTNASRLTANSGQMISPDYFFAVNRTRASGGIKAKIWRKNLTHISVMEVIQSVCCTLGIPSGTMSSKSFRINYATVREARFKHGSLSDKECIDPLLNWTVNSQMQIVRYSRCQYLTDDQIQEVARAGAINITHLFSIWNAIGAGQTTTLRSSSSTATGSRKGGVAVSGKDPSVDDDSSGDEGTYAGVLLEMEKIQNEHSMNVPSISI